MGQATATNTDSSKGHPPLAFWQVVGSVFAAGFGVQSKENKERDFSRGQAKHFIVAGVLFTVGLLAVLIAVVNLVV